jgi:hypothetical protein
MRFICEFTTREMTESFGFCGVRERNGLNECDYSDFEPQDFHVHLKYIYFVLVKT